MARGGGGVPHGLPCSCVEPGEAGWVLSHVARRESKKDQILGHVGHPRPPILVMQAGPGWAVLGEVGMASLLILSPKSPASPSQGARLRPGAWPPLVILLYCGRGAAAAAPLLAALALGSVACNDSPSEEGLAQRAQGTQPVSQPGQVTLHFSPPAHYHVTSQSRLSPQPSPLLVALPSPASQGTCRKLTHSNQPTNLCGL